MKPGQKHTIKGNNSYFLTLTVVDWIDVFSRKVYCDIILDSLKYCIKTKGLNVYAFVITSNHLHLIVNCNEPFQLKDAIRDFKKFTAKQIIAEIQNGIESRKEWLLKLFIEAGNSTSKNKTYKFWQTGNHAIELCSPEFSWRKIEYIHQNPVRAGLVEKSVDWLNSSARNYQDYEDVKLADMCCLTAPLTSVK